MDKRVNKASIHSQASPELDLPGFGHEDRNDDTRFRFSTDKRACRCTAARLGVAAFFGLMATEATAQIAISGSESMIAFPMSHIMTLLFLMLGPTKIIGPFVKMTVGADDPLQRKIALMATMFSAIALLIAGLLGETILRKHGVPLPILALAAGIILFLVAVQDTVRQFTLETQPSNPKEAEKPSIKLALDPLAFPVIVTPYGIAALIVFLSFEPNVQDQLTIGAIVAVILLMNLVTMIFARKLLASMGIALAILGAVLSVVQVALGLQIISNSLKALGVG